MIQSGSTIDMRDDCVKHKDTTERIYNELLESITNGSFAPGAKMPSENELKDRYGVSRNTIRLVLKKLSAVGIVETRRGDGTYVRKAGANVSLNMMVPSLVFEKHDLMDILEFRKGIEIQAVKLAALRATDEDVGKLKTCLRRMKKHMFDMREFEIADADMHVQLAKASKNEMFGSMMEIIHSILTNEMKTLLVRQGKDIDSFFYHSQIIDCIENRKPEEAAFMMEKHLDLIIDRASATKRD